VTDFVPFDQVEPLLMRILEQVDPRSLGLSELWVVRDLMGRIRFLLPEPDQLPGATDAGTALRGLAGIAHQTLGARAYEPERAVVTVGSQELNALRNSALRYDLRGFAVYVVDRLLAGSEWSTVPPMVQPLRPLRFTLFAIKGGTGRSTTAVVLANHLAEQNYRVLVLDLDLESPGLSPLLLDEGEHPDFGIVDWFVEDLVGQGDKIVPDMIGRPRWSQDLGGDILVVPACGRGWKNYLHKLGRVYLDRPREGAGIPPERWTLRLLRLLQVLENHERPDVVLLDTRSGLHDLAAAAVTDVQAHVLLFAVDSEATWTGYRILFDHWAAYRAATEIRRRLSLVAALVPESEMVAHLERVCEHSWDLFRDHLYDDLPPGAVESAGDGPFSFDLNDEAAPHYPMPILWSSGVAALSSHRDLQMGWRWVSPAYARFFELFDALFRSLREDSR
jgi:CO dehydrogenase nickel-insertion accessory protein CooC1